MRLDHIVLDGDYETNYQIEPNDRVWVPPHAIAVFAYWVDQFLWPLRSSASAVATMTRFGEQD